MLNLPPHTAKLTHLNLREETHGGEKRKALDLSLEVVFSADTIDEMVPGAKIAFWKPPELPPAATAEQLFDGKDKLEVPPTLRRLAAVESFKADKVFAGRLVTIPWGIGDDMEFDCSKAHKFVITPLDQAVGKVKYMMSVYTDSEQIAQLADKLSTELEITMADGDNTPPGGQRELAGEGAEA